MRLHAATLDGGQSSSRGGKRLDASIHPLWACPRGSLLEGIWTLSLVIGACGLLAFAERRLLCAVTWLASLGGAVDNLTVLR